MKFGPVPVDDALGATLAHSLQAGQGRLRKGRVLTARDLAALKTAGHRTVTVARLDPGDLDEDAAAARIARALVGVDGSGVQVTPAATGRVNLRAGGPGVVTFDADAVHALNAVDPMITVATLPQFARVGCGQLVATIKIISFAVAGALVDRACAAVSGAAVTLHRPRLRHAALIETRIGADEPSPKGREALVTRLSRLGVDLAPRVVVPHDIEKVRDALADAQTDLIFILTGSATSDIADTAPSALVAAGGQVVQYGLPVDPGNLLFLGSLRDVPVIGLPGCARSPALNGADWILERVICGLDIGPAQIAAMGLGGLLKEIPSRPRPREIG